MKNFIKNLADGGLAEDIYAAMERILDEQPEPEMVNRQEFITKAKSWVKNCFTGPFDEGMANNIANEFEKYMEE